MLTLIGFFDFIGTIAFAVAGALTGIRRRMDLFGVNMLAIATATGGGMIRDILIGHFPPAMFRDPTYVAVAAVTANVVFVLVWRYSRMPSRLLPVYDSLLFWCDTLGLAAFSVGGVMVGVEAGYGENLFLLAFLGFLTGVGGGLLRDMMACRLPDIFVKHIYALAAHFLWNLPRIPERDPAAAAEASAGEAAGRVFAAPGQCAEKRGAASRKREGA